MSHSGRHDFGRHGVRKRPSHEPRDPGVIGADQGPPTTVDIPEAAVAPVSDAALAVHTSDTSDAHDASAISFTPAGTIAATDVQAAIEEVAAEAGSPADILDLPTVEMDDTLVLAPDGVGGVEFRAEAVVAHLADAADAHDASAISVLDTAGNFTGTDVETVLDELFDAISGGGIPATIVDAKGDLLAASAADTVARLAVGANGDVLTADSGEALGVKWLAPVVGMLATLFAAKGDLLGASANDTPAILSVGSNGQRLKADSAEATGLKWVDDLATLQFIIDGGGSAITTGVKGFIEVPFGCTITAVRLLADQSGSIVVDIWKDTYANYPPVDADSITASAVPTISATTKSQDTTLTGWTTAVAAGDILGFNVDSITTCTRVTVSLTVKKT